MKTHARTHARAMFPEGDGRSEGGGSLEDCNGSVTTTADLDKPEKLFCNTTPKDPLGGEEWEVILQAKSHLCTKAGDSTRPFLQKMSQWGKKKKRWCKQESFFSRMSVQLPASHGDPPSMPQTDEGVRCATAREQQGRKRRRKNPAGEKRLRLDRLRLSL